MKTTWTLLGVLWHIVISYTYGQSATDCEKRTAGSDYIDILTSHGNISQVLNGNYPNNYIKCWLIRAELNGKVKVHLIKLNLQQKDTNGACRDWLRIYEGEHIVTTQLKAEYCGNFNDTFITSSGEAMTLVFRTDGNLTDKGFEVHFYAVDWDYPIYSSGLHIAVIAVIIAIVLMAVVITVLALIGGFTWKKHKYKHQIKNNEDQERSINVKTTKFPNDAEHWSENT